MSRSLRREAALVPAIVLLAGLTLAGCETLIVGAAAGPRVPPEQRHVASEPSIDVEHYALDVVLDPGDRSLDGTCTVRFFPKREGMSAIELHLEGLQVQSVVDGAGQTLAFAQADGRLTIQWPAALPTSEFGEVAIHYSGVPAKGLWYVGARDGLPTQVFTQGECEDARWWFPCHDVPSDRASSEVRVTMPAHWTSVAAGERISSESGGATKTEHWRMTFPHPPYLVTLVAGEFETTTADWNGVPLSYLTAPSQASFVPAVFESTPRVLDFLEELTGLDYPYPKYSQACVDNFPFGGMENISATTLTDSIMVDERGLRDRDAEGLIAHEAAHQWFGDLMTCKEWSHIWLNEGFATYAEKLFIEREYGLDRFRIAMRDAQEAYLKEDEEKRRPIVWNVYRDPIDLFGGHVYPGAAARLHLLRFHVGDDAFFRGLRTYVGNNAGRSVLTDDFRRAMEQESGLDLRPFFDQWLFAAGHPDFQVSWEYDEIERVVELTVSQLQRSLHGTPAVFETPVLVEVRTGRGQESHRLTVDERREIFRIASSERPEWVRFDKYGWIPKRVTAKKAPEEWLLIAAEDDDPNGRRDALLALGDLAAESVVSAKQRMYVAQIGDRLRRDPVDAVRVSAARALGVAGGPEARAQLVTAAAADDAAAVRVASLESLRRWGADMELATLALAQYEAGYSWRTMSAAAALFARARPDEAYEWFVRQLFVESPRDVLQQHLLVELANLDHESVPEQLLRWARDESLAPEARAAAVMGVARLGTASPLVARDLRALLDSDQFRVRKAVLEGLERFDDVETKHALGAFYRETVFPREKRAVEAALGL